ncbi:MAG TPA: SulP family inorganic anion transporter [candidate division Zixibacteria bacterium]|nr:SulP family inorganic anion transporter [candidate division Zixibacteria bacterium]
MSTSVTKTTPTQVSRLESWVPGIQAFRTYQRAWLGRDVMAGLILCALLIPQGMAYAELAGLPAITGLYTTIICLVAYAAFGPSPYLVLGPDSSLGPMIAAIILPMAAGNTEYAVALAGMLALMVGIIALVAGIGRLGFISDLLSKPVRVGYMAGLAITIFFSQLPKLFGFSVDGGNIIVDIREFLTNLDQTNVWALGIGVLSLVIVLGLRRRSPRIPGILIAVVVAIAISSLFDFAVKGVDVVGVLLQGFPMPSFPAVDIADLPLLAAGALGITLVAIGDTISVSAGFAARRGDEVDSDQELVGIGAANFLSGFFHGFPVSTSSSRTAVAEQAGAKSQLTGLLAAVLVLLMLLFVPGLVQNLPESVLAAVIIIAASTLLDIPELRHLWNQRKSEFYLAVISLLGVALIGVLEGIVIAVMVSIIQLFIRAWRPHSAVLGKTKSVAGYHDITRYPEAILTPGMLMLRWDAPLFFANANLFRRRVRELVKQTDPTPRWIVLAAEPITDVDTTAADMLVELDEELNAAGIHLILAELKDPVKDKIERYGLYDTIDRRHFFPLIEEAVEAFHESETDQPA